jgi:integrase
MARSLKRLTAVSIAALKKPGRHADGGNLYLTVSKTPSGLSKHWTFMFTLDGKQREAGFGPIGTISLSEAREKARQWRGLLLDGIDPLAAKQAARDAARAAKVAGASRRTFGQCADNFVKSKRMEWRSEIHAGQWQTTLNQYCSLIWAMPVDEVDTVAVLSVLKPIWSRIPETASRLRGRIEAVLNFAKAHRLRDGENSAAWKGNLADILPRRQKLARPHHAALAYRDVPEFIGKLRQTETITALALEFTILTAARVGEVTGAKWPEFDMANKVWVIPAHRMKSGREHRVPLSSRTFEIVEAMAKIRSGDFVFPGIRLGRPISHSSFKRESPAGATIDRASGRVSQGLLCDLTRERKSPISPIWRRTKAGQSSIIWESLARLSSISWIVQHKLIVDTRLNVLLVGWSRYCGKWAASPAKFHALLA